MKTTIKKLVVLTLTLALMLPGAGTVYAANLTVTKTADTNDGVCDADCSLREAISAAVPGDTITVPANTNAYTLTQGHLFINKNLTINGSGMGNTIIEQTNPNFRVIDIGNPGGPAPVVSISRLTIKGGNAISPSNSQAFPGHTHGGGIHNHGIVTLTNVTFTGNSSIPANDLGGGFYNAGTATIVNVTIAENSAPAGFGGGIAGATATLTLTNTIVANNTGGNCFAAITSGSNNLQFPGTTCGATITTADPMFGPLTNGVYPLLAGGPAIDTGTNTGCPPTDQLGTARPIDGDATPGAVCDIGSIEAPAFVAPGPTCNGQTATIYVNAQGRIVGGPNNGQVYSGKLNGTSGADVMVGTNGRDEFSARGGNDVLCGRGNNDELEGGGGRDRIFGEEGNDILAGEGGNDTLTGGPGADRFRGGEGTDTATDFTPAQGDTKIGVENF
jgi:CSLREA domain-containing protein